MKQPTRCDRLIQIRAPEFLTKALDSAADKRLTSRSDYIRTALLDRLRADGIDPAPAASSAPDLSALGALA
jgi:Ribbon-helix-helix protein, copG family